MKHAELDSLLRKAIDEVVAEHRALITVSISERALTHQIALSIRKLISTDYDVDVEYNRHFDDPKRLQLPDRKASDRETKATTVFPDIIIHKRGRDSDNLLVLEIKKPDESLKYDKIKLSAFVRELGYKNAAHLILGLDRNNQVVKEVYWETKT